MSIVAVLLLAGELIRAPNEIPFDSGAIAVRLKRGGGVRWTAEWTMAPAEHQGRKAVRFTEQGRGRLHPYMQDVRWSLEALWLAGDGFRPLEFEKTVTGLNGGVLAAERKRFDPAKGVVRFERIGAGGRSEVRTLETAADVLAVEGIAGVLRFLPFGRFEKFSSHILSNEPKQYPVTFQPRGRERVETPAGAFECYKVEVVPDAGFLNLFRLFFPKAFFWFTADPPHFWVRYEGPESGPGSPEVVMELTSSKARTTP